MAEKSELAKVTDEDINATRNVNALSVALSYAGLLGENTVACPMCGKTSELGKNKFKMFPDGGWKHFGADGCYGDAIGVLTNSSLQLSFPDAVRLLVGKPTSVVVEKPAKIVGDLTVSAFKANMDAEVYQGVLIYGRKAFNGAGVQKAIDFYAQWHIDAQVVKDSGAVYITDPKHFAEAIERRFGIERLINCGLFVVNKNDQPMCLINHKWPVVEPGKNSEGVVTNLQFRASNEQYERYLKHKRGELSYEGNQKFVNLRGVRPESYLGSGIDVIAQLPERSQVYVVEGFKDRLSAMTLGVNAYAIPGVGYRPGKEVLEVLSRHDVILSLDGDEAGLKGVYGTIVQDKDGNEISRKPGLLDYLQKHDVQTWVHPLKNDFDITDRLVQKHAQNGCECAQCNLMRTRLNALEK